MVVADGQKVVMAETTVVVQLSGVAHASQPEAVEEAATDLLEVHGSQVPVEEAATDFLVVEELHPSHSPQLSVPLADFLVVVLDVHGSQVPVEEAATDFLVVVDVHGSQVPLEAVVEDVHGSHVPVEDAATDFLVVVVVVVVSQPSHMSAVARPATATIVAMENFILTDIFRDYSTGRITSGEG